MFITGDQAGWSDTSLAKAGGGLIDGASCLSPPLLPLAQLKLLRQSIGVEQIVERDSYQSKSGTIEMEGKEERSYHIESLMHSGDWEWQRLASCDGSEICKSNFDGDCL